MKKINRIAGISLLATILFACTSDYESINTDPARLSNVSPAYILPFVQETVVHLHASPYELAENLHTQAYCQYYTNTNQGWTADRYGYNDGWVAPGFWEPYYTALKHLKVVGELLEEYPSYTNYYQMLRIIVAYGTIGMTDTFGDIPYSDAATGNTMPAYDTQKDIYYDVFKQLTEAVGTLNQNLPNQEACGADNDLIYGGNLSKWVKFANSLRLRFALRLTFIEPDKAKTEGEAALQAGVMASNDDNAYLRVTTAGGWGHPLYMISMWNVFAMSKTMENILKAASTVSDPRMPLWFGQTIGYVNNTKNPNPGFKGTQFQGVPNGRTDEQLLSADADGYIANEPNNNSFVYGLQAFPDWNSNDIAPTGSIIAYPFKIMNYAETCQLKAEAALYGWAQAGDAKTNYETGIRSSFSEERLYVSESLYDATNDETYITTGDVAWNEADNTEKKLEKIIIQKWLATYPNGTEAWAECRRTGYPVLMPIARSEDPDVDPSKGELIKKIRYTDSERRDNAANATDLSLNQGQGDGINVRVWWDTARYD